MKMKDSIFLSEFESQGPLFYDHLFFDAPYPMLFTVRDSRGQKYLVSCPKADAKSREWIVTETSTERINAMLRSEITLRETFQGEGKQYHLVQKAGESAPSIAAFSIPENLLPTEGCFWGLQ